MVGRPTPSVLHGVLDRPHVGKQEGTSNKVLRVQAGLIEQSRLLVQGLLLTGSPLPHPSIPSLTPPSLRMPTRLQALGLVEEQHRAGAGALVELVGTAHWAQLTDAQMVWGDHLMRAHEAAFLNVLLWLNEM